MLTRSKKRLLLSSRLYLILDRNSCYPSDVISIFRRVGRIGVDLVQLRENTACDRDFLRDAKAIKRICKEKGIIFIINNRLDIAQLAGADGLHLGQTDLPLKEVRKIFGKNRIVGVSCHNLTEALKAQSEGADYIGIGPIFSTTIKPNLKPIKLSSIKLINQKIKIPFFAIGGINRSNINKVISYGAKRVALCRAVCCAKNVKKAISELRSKINSARL